MSRLFNFLIACPRSSLLVVLIATLVISLGTLRLKIDFSPEQVYVGADNAVAFCEAHKKLFRFEDSIVLILLESTDGRSLIREDCLNWMSRLAAAAETLDGVREVTSIVTLERPRVSLDGNTHVTWSPFLAPDYYGNEDYVARRLERVPLLNDTLVSQDRQLMMTLVDLDPDDRTITRATARVRSIEHTLAGLPLPDGTMTSMSGVPAIRVDVIDSILRDQMQMVPVCSALFLLVSLLMFRSFSVTMLSLFSALSTVALTMGFMGWLNVTFSVMSNMIPALLLIVAAANNVHVLSRFQVEVRQSGRDLESCARSTMHEMSRTCFLTLATSGIGFGSLLIARAELLQSLALQAAGGMICCYAALMLILPQTLVLCGPALARRSGTRQPQLTRRLLSVIGPNSRTVASDNRPPIVRSETDSSANGADCAEGAGSAHHKRASAGHADRADQSSTDRPATSRLDGMWRTFGAVISRNSAAIVTLHLLLAAWTLWSCRNIAINSYMLETYDGDHPTIQTVRKMDQRMSGLISLEVQLRAETRERLFDEDLAAALSRLREILPQDDRITFYRDYIEFLSVFDHGRTLVSDPAEAAKSLQRVQLALRQLDNQDVTSAFLADGQPAARVMMRIRDVGSAGMKDLIRKVSMHLNQELPEDIAFSVTGDAYLHAICMDAFVRDLFYSLIAASGVIFLLITLLFRSLKIGLIASVPNMFPLIMTLGYMHLRGYELTAGNVIVFAISLGIAVDDTIHFLARYRDERKRTSAREAIQATLFSSGRAIVLTSVLVVSGLSVLIFSDFVPTRRFAELTAITMCSALPGDVILLPALLALFDGRRPGSAACTDGERAAS
ncbi:MAG: efflux RND transporter permease subunit [Fuerstiella sp.]